MANIHIDSFGRKCIKGVYETVRRREVVKILDDQEVEEVSNEEALQILNEEITEEEESRIIEIL